MNSQVIQATEGETLFLSHLHYIFVIVESGVKHHKPSQTKPKSFVSAIDNRNISIRNINIF
jgi:hypothetical protein